MQISNYLPALLKTATNPKDYAKSFAYYLDRKTAVARELTELLLGIFKSGDLFNEDGSVNTDLLPESYWYTPVKASLAISSQTAERSSIYVTAIELARSINGLIATDESALYDVPIIHEETIYSSNMSAVLKDLDLNAYDMAFNGMSGDPIHVNLPFPCFIGGSPTAVSSFIVDGPMEVDPIVVRDPESMVPFSIDVVDTLANLVSCSHQVTMQSTVLAELGNAVGNLTASDLTCKMQAMYGASASAIMSTGSQLIGIATDTSITIEDRIAYVVKSIVPDAKDTQAIVASESDDSDLFAVISSDDFKGTDMAAMWSMANCSNAFETAFGIVSAVVCVAGKLVIAALEGLYNLTSRLWRKYVEPAYISKDFVKSEYDTNENYCDIPLLYFGSAEVSSSSVHFDKVRLASMLKSKFNEQSHRFISLDDSELSLSLSGPNSDPSVVSQLNCATLQLTSRNVSKCTSQYDPIKLRTRRLMLDSTGKYFSSAPDISASYSEYNVALQYGCIIKDSSGAVVHSDTKNAALPGSGSTASGSFASNLTGAWSVSNDVSSAFNVGNYGITTYYQQNSYGIGQNMTEIRLIADSYGTYGGSDCVITIPGYVTNITMDENNLGDSYKVSYFSDYLIKVGSKYEKMHVCKSGKPGQFSHCLFSLGEYLPTASTRYKAGYITVDTSNNMEFTFRVMTKPRSVVVSLNKVRIWCRSEWLTVYAEGSSSFAKPTVTETDFVGKIATCLPGDTVLCNNYHTFQCSNIKSATLEPVFEVNVPLSGISYSDGYVRDCMGNPIFSYGYDANQVRFDNSIVPGGDRNIPCGVNVNSTWFTGDSADLLAYCYDVDLDYKASMVDPEGVCKLASVYCNLSFIIRLSPASNHTKQVTIKWKDMDKLPDQSEGYYSNGGGQYLNYRWGPLCSYIDWYSLPISTLPDEDVNALLKDVKCPVDSGCACVTRYVSGAIQIVSSESKGLVGVVYAAPMRYSDFFLDDGQPRYRYHDGQYSLLTYDDDDHTSFSRTDFSSESAFFDSFCAAICASCSQSSGDYTVGDDGDKYAYKDMYTGKWVMDVLMYCTANPQSDLSTILSNSVAPVWHIFKDSAFSPADTNNKAFYDLLLGNGVTSAVAVEQWMYAYLFNIVSNKEAYMRVYFKLFGSSPSFYPYLIGDRLSYPKWHISTDNEIQSYVDTMCAALVVAIAVIAAVVLIGVAVFKIRNVLKLKINESAARESSLKMSHGRSVTERDQLVNERKQLLKSMKSMDKSSPEYAAALAQIDALSTNIKSAKLAAKASGKALLKSQKLTKRWTKLAGIFGVPLTTGDAVKDAFADDSPNDYQDGAADDSDDIVLDMTEQIRDLESILSAQNDSMANSFTQIEEAVANVAASSPDVDFTGVLSAISLLKDSITSTTRNGPLDM